MWPLQAVSCAMLPLPSRGDSKLRNAAQSRGLHVGSLIAAEHSLIAQPA